MRRAYSIAQETYGSFKHSTMTTTKVFIEPNPFGFRPDKADGGIRRVVEAQQRYLPLFDVEVVDNPKNADIINNHGTSQIDVKGIPIVNSNHGLLWSRYVWGGHWAEEVNREVIKAMKMAYAVTAPSEWVASSLRRGMFVYPEVVYHGVEVDDWEMGQPQDYILWNKARRDVVSNPDDMQRLAELLPSYKFVTTIGEPKPNVKIAGVMPYPEMKNVVRSAGLYLATARETFGIGTLEALACGVPVVGWDWGGQSEIIVNGETGYLAPPGDYEALAECVVRAVKERSRLSANARNDVIERWTWQPRIQQYADLYKSTLNKWNALSPKVSVVVPCHNLGAYLGDALKSVQSQTMQDWECLVVDDFSTDGTPEIANSFVKQDSRFKYIKTPVNLKLSMTKNFGVEHTTGRYVIPLDADDIMDEESLRILSDALDNDKSIHIVYGHIDVLNTAGNDKRRNDWPFPQFSWRGQMAHLNQLPYCAMVRREVFERSGGFRKRHWRAEDANFWCRVTSFGFVAKKVTERSLLLYRLRSDSKSRGEDSDGDWTQWYPWRIAGDPREGFRKQGLMQSRTVPNPALVPFGAQGKPGRDLLSWYAHDFSYPRISVIIPVGKGHEEYLIDAIDSVVAQTYPDWELIVVNDTGSPMSTIPGAPFAKIINTTGGIGVSAARNLGVKASKGEAIFPLDADDYILPNCLERMAAHLEEYNGIIYSGWLKNEMNSKDMQYYQPKEFVCGATITKMQHSGSSILIPRWLFDKIGGWDEKIPGWEDWDFLIAAQHHGACSYCVTEPLFVYRFFSGTQREKAYNNPKPIVDYIDAKWYPYRKGEKKMGCGCKGKKVIVGANSTLSSSGNFVPDEGPEMVLMEYRGQYDGPITFRGQATGLKYRFGKNEANKHRFVRREDAQDFLERNGKDGPEFVLVGKSGKDVAEGFAETPILPSLVPEMPIPA